MRKSSGSDSNGNSKTAQQLNDINLLRGKISHQAHDKTSSLNQHVSRLSVSMLISHWWISRGTHDEINSNANKQDNETNK